MQFSELRARGETVNPDLYKEFALQSMQVSIGSEAKRIDVFSPQRTRLLMIGVIPGEEGKENFVCRCVPW